MKLRELTPEQQKIISNVIDQVIDEYADNNKIIFSSESERAKFHFGSVDKQLRHWKKSKQCMVPGCSEQSIKKSHTIPKGLSLNQISENGHLLTPQFDHQIGEIVLKSVGVSLASTFPGFCSVHEPLFEEFEKQKKIETGTHVYLQTYRAACRELFRTKSLIKHSKWLLSHYCQLRDARLLEIVKQRAFDNGFPNSAIFKTISIKNDPLIELVNDQIPTVQRLFSHIQDRILPGLEKAVFHGSENDIFIEVINVDIMIPVALSGCSTFYINDQGIKMPVDLILNVIPSNGYSLLIFCGDILNKDFIEQYIFNWCANSFTLLSMVESWMVNGTDQWYITPSVWDEISNRRKRSILNAIYECKQTIGQEFGLSIFDSIRKNMLTMLKEKEEPTQDDKYWHFVKAQKTKMT